LQIKSAEALRQLDELQADRLLQVAAAREAADVAPQAEEKTEHGRDAAFEAKLAEWRGRWAGVRSWFVGERSRPSQASLLRQHARASIPAHARNGDAAA